MILEFKGIPIFYSDSGKGQALVFLHGFLENSTIWSPFVQELSKHNRIICIDLLGHGQTGCLGKIHTMETMAEAVKFVLDHLQIKRSLFFGHSMGGYVALAFAEKYPKSVRGICLINSTAKADSIEKKLNRDRAIKAVIENHETFISLAISNLFRPINREKFKNEIVVLKEDALKTPISGITAALEGMKLRKDKVITFTAGEYKKKLIIGRNDPVLNYKDLIAQTKNTDVEIVEFEDGHMSFIENSQELLHEIVRFIE
ncbi:MAG: alpha/beta fold hydrolase [Jejuia sp.]